MLGTVLSLRPKGLPGQASRWRKARARLTASVMTTNAVPRLAGRDRADCWKVRRRKGQVDRMAVCRPQVAI